MQKETPLDEYENVFLRRAMTIFIYIGTAPLFMVLGIIIVMAEGWKKFFIPCWDGKGAKRPQI